MPRDSPTVGKGTMRIFLAISSINNWTIKTTDIKSAFLQGKEIRRDVDIKPPKESGVAKGIIWKTLWIKGRSKTILPECEGRITGARLQNV